MNKIKKKQSIKMAADKANEKLFQKRSIDWELFPLLELATIWRLNVHCLSTYFIPIGAEDSSARFVERLHHGLFGFFICVRIDFSE